MSNVIDFPLATAVDARVQGHVVQFYENDAFLVNTLGKFLSAGLDSGDRIIVIATSAHRDSLLDSVHGARDAIKSEQLLMLDAHGTLAKFMVGGMPDPDLFLDLVSRLMAKAQNGDPHARVRAFGEMVDVLWRGGHAAAAIRLEELWNDAAKVHRLSLMCAYMMGNFYKTGDSERFMDVCLSHTHVLPTERFCQLDDASARLREISLLQQGAHALKAEVQYRKILEAALRDALRERGRVDEELRASLKRENAARGRAEESDVFKEIFLGVLGHELRNPLSTILTTTRLMAMRRELPAESRTRLARMLSSGVRMQRMIEQILDVARVRLAGGMTLERGDHNLTPRVARIVKEMRASHPGRQIVFESEETCRARVDTDRFEQVVSNLVGNAIAHGHAERPIQVKVTACEHAVRLVVRNDGVPIDPELMPFLFDPFRRSRKPPGVSEGLGLGLYISERIINALGGKISVESSAEAGTSFEVTLLRT